MLPQQFDLLQLEQQYIQQQQQLIEMDQINQNPSIPEFNNEFKKKMIKFFVLFKNQYQNIVHKQIVQHIFLKYLPKGIPPAFKVHYFIRNENDGEDADIIDLINNKIQDFDNPQEGDLVEDVQMEYRMSGVYKLRRNQEGHLFAIFEDNFDDYGILGSPEICASQQTRNHNLFIGAYPHSEEHTVFVHVNNLDMKNILEGNDDDEQEEIEIPFKQQFYGSFKNLIVERQYLQQIQQAYDEWEQDNSKIKVIYCELSSENPEEIKFCTEVDEIIYDTHRVIQCQRLNPADFSSFLRKMN